MPIQHLLTIKDLIQAEVQSYLELAKRLKKEKKDGQPHRHCEGKNIVLLFQKDSTRTRCAFEVAAADLGMNTTYIGPSGSQMGNKESIKDTARVLGRMYDGIQFRGHAHEDIEILANYAGVPVWNGLTDAYHPTQVLADLMTIEEQFGPLKRLKIAYMGDARNNVAHSLMLGAAKMGMNFTAIAPSSLAPEASLFAFAKEEARKYGGSVSFTDNPSEGVRDQHVIYTDVWVSMGEPAAVWEERIALLHSYQVNEHVMQQANSKAIFLHCLPAFHGLDTVVGKEIAQTFGERFEAVRYGAMEVTNAIIESTQSRVFDQAENRLHTIKAIMMSSLK